MDDLVINKITNYFLKQVHQLRYNHQLMSEELFIYNRYKPISYCPFGCCETGEIIYLFSSQKKLIEFIKNKLFIEMIITPVRSCDKDVSKVMSVDEIIFRLLDRKNIWLDVPCSQADATGYIPKTGTLLEYKIINIDDLN